MFWSRKSSFQLVRCSSCILEIRRRHVRTVRTFLTNHQKKKKQKKNALKWFHMCYFAFQCKLMNWWGGNHTVNMCKTERHPGGRPACTQNGTHLIRFNKSSVWKTVIPLIHIQKHPLSRQCTMCNLPSPQKPRWPQYTKTAQVEYHA